MYLALHTHRSTEGYSCSDLTSLAKDAAFGPIRDLDPSMIKGVEKDKVLVRVTRVSLPHNNVW